MQFCIKKNGEEYLSLAKRLPALEAAERERLSVLQTEFSACIRQVVEASKVESLPADQWQKLSDVRSWTKAILCQVIRIEWLDADVTQQFSSSLDFLDKHHPYVQEHTHAESSAEMAMA